MHFNENDVETFLKIFQKHRVAIRKVKGCAHLELLKDVNRTNVYTTLSHWKKSSDLENYRNSELFKEVWGKVKPLFSTQAQAFSLEKVLEL
jgi:(4S)-4-hydroxy-5-phosphonooxypentane-2,3-dione isomerase